ncbi:MAG TPA: histidine kinase [Streptosporangiaceae bacterium]|nr:histidine kinase [Streptosporangiaceae bacterium]
MGWQTPGRFVSRLGAAPPPGTAGGPAPLWPWLRSPRAADACLAIGVAVVGVASALGARHHHEYVPLAAVAILAAMGLVLAARRRYPGSVLAAEAALVASLAGLGTTLEAGFLAVLIASYSAVVYAARRVSASLTVAAVAVLAGTPVALAVHGLPASGLHPPLTTVLAAAGAVVVGWFVRRQFSLRAAQLALLAERADLAAEHQRTQTQRARLAERLRIARELHDIVAHHISVAVIQAQGAQRVAGHDLPRALEAMAEVERTGRTALEEMRRLVGLLRSGEPAGDGSAADGAARAQGAEDAGRTAPPGLSDIGELAERMRSAGLDLTVSTTGEPCEVPGHVGLAGYRIVQEALTNALKHAGPAHVTVGLDFGEDLEILVADDGRGAAAALGGTGLPGGGRGLAGMAERAAAAGGTLVAGPRPGGGFRVHATIPLAQP